MARFISIFGTHKKQVDYVNAERISMVEVTEKKHGQFTIWFSFVGGATLTVYADKENKEKLINVLKEVHNGKF